jgi:Kef-type K+ transport system membrane component KefB
MPELTFLPDWPPVANPLLLFGVLLAAGLMGGELVKRVLHIPRITGYVLVGLVLGQSGFRVITPDSLTDANIFVDIALGLVLFELGRRLSIDWFRKDPWLLATGVLESALSFACIFGALMAFDVRPLHAAVAAAIGVSTSPAVVMLVARELRAEGQVIERALHLLALNNVVAFTLVAMLLSALHHEYEAGWINAVLHPVYLLAGSLGLGLAAAWSAVALSRWVGKRADQQIVVLLALVIVTVGLARMLDLSVLVALLAFGVLARALDRRHDLMAVDTLQVGQIFFVVLFVVAGASLVLSELAVGGTLAIVYIVARFVGKSVGIMTLTPLSGVRAGNAGLLCIALVPMSGLALAMVQGTARFFPQFGAELGAIVLSAVLLLELIGPLAVQFALRQAGEVAEEAR